MQSVLEKLVRARTAGVVISLFLLAGVLAVTIHVEPWRTVLAASSLGALAVALLIIVALQKTEVVQAKAVHRAIGKHQRDSLEVLGAQSRHFAALKSQLEELRDESFNRQASETGANRLEQPDPPSFFSPNRVLSHKILERPSSQQAGRNAANQVAAGDVTKVLEDMLAGDESDWERKIISVCSPTLKRRLSEVANVEPLQPGLLIGAPNSDVAYIVLDEAYLNSGIWSGTLDTVGTNDFLALVDFIKGAKQHGALVIVLADSVKSHFNDELRSKADIVVADGRSDLRWERDVNLPILNLVIDESVEV